MQQNTLKTVNEIDNKQTNLFTEFQIHWFLTECKHKTPNENTFHFFHSEYKQ